jgi:hypothetical protein
MNKKKILLHRSRADADLRFYEGYDPRFLWNKGWLLFQACQHRDALQAFAKSVGGDEQEADTSVFQSYVAELHFSVLHQFEALFALMLAQFQPLPHWIFLTEYRTQEIKSKAESYVARDYRSASNGSCSTQKEFVGGAVYPGVVPPPDHQEGWGRCLSDIGWLIEEGAQRYLAGKEYNAYKHGLRVLPGSMTLMVGIGPEPKNMAPVLSMASSISYLEEEEPDSVRRFAEVTKEVKAEDAYHWMGAMMTIAEILRDVRLAGLRNSSIQIQTVTIDREGLSRLKPISKFRMSL